MSERTKSWLDLLAIFGWLVVLPLLMFSAWEDRVNAVIRAEADRIAELPMGHWYVPGPVIVSDAVSGECPLISYSRTIMRPFDGGYITVLERRTSAGGWAVAGVGSDAVPYSPDRSLPDEMDLEWWSGGEISCDIDPGTYRLRTTWWVDVAPGVRRQTTETSLPFEVRESA